MTTLTSRDDSLVLNEDSIRLAKLGYRQEVRRIFMATTNFGLTASMISVLLGILPLYDYSLATGGPAVMFWSQIIVGVVSTAIVSVVGEISSSMPTMGCLLLF